MSFLSRKFIIISYLLIFPPTPVRENIEGEEEWQFSFPLLLSFGSTRVNIRSTRTLLCSAVIIERPVAAHEWVYHSVLHTRYFVTDVPQLCPPGSTRWPTRRIGHRVACRPAASAPRNHDAHLLTIINLETCSVAVRRSLNSRRDELLNSPLCNTGKRQRLPQRSAVRISTADRPGKCAIGHQFTVRPPALCDSWTRQCSECPSQEVTTIHCASPSFLPARLQSRRQHCFQFHPIHYGFLRRFLPDT